MFLSLFIQTFEKNPFFRFNVLSQFPTDTEFHSQTVLVVFQMGDDPHPSAPAATECVSKNEKASSWNIDELQRDEELNSSQDFFSALKTSVAKHVYPESGERVDRGDPLPNRTINRSAPSTVRLDSSDLISRCRNFLPLLTDANRALLSKIEAGENVRLELDSDEDEHANEEARTIEMNLMFCPDVDSSSSESESDTSDEVSSNSDEDESNHIASLRIINKRRKKSSQVNIVEVVPNDLVERVDNAEEDLHS